MKLNSERKRKKKQVTAMNQYKKLEKYTKDNLKVLHTESVDSANIIRICIENINKAKFRLFSYLFTYIKANLRFLQKTLIL